MQGSRGLLMGFGKAKLVAPPVRKFAPSIKIQSQNPAPVVVNESESERSLSTAITDEIEPLPFLLNEMNKLTASAGVIAADCMSGGVESRGVVPPHKVHANELLALSIVTSNEVDDNITIIESSTNAVISPVDNGSNAFDGENITNADTMGATVAILIGGSKKPKIVPRPRISFSQPAISAEHVITRGPIPGSDGDVAVLSDGVTNTHLKSIATPASSSSSSTGKRKDSQGDSSGSDDEDDNEDLYAAALTKRKRSGAANKKNPKSKGKVTVSRASKKGDTNSNSNTNTNTTSPAISQTEIILPNRRVGKVLNVASEMVIAREMWSNIAENNVTGQTPNLIPEQSVDQIPKKKIVKRVRKNQIPLENSENTQPTKRKKVATKDGGTKRERDEEVNIIRQQIDFKMFPDFNHDFKEKLSKKAGVEIGFSYVITIRIKERAQVLPLRFGDRTYKIIRAYLHRYPPPTGLGMRIRNLDGKAVVRGFSLPVVISDEMKAEEANRLAVRSALQSASQLKTPVLSEQPPPVIQKDRGLESYDVESSVDDDPLTRDNPAYLAGVRLNDVIMSVNNTDARSSSFEQILRALTGNTYTPRNIEDTDVNNTTTATSGIVHPCHGQPSCSKGMAVAAVDHIVCITFARSQSVRADSCTASLLPPSNQSSSTSSSTSSSRTSSSSSRASSSSSRASFSSSTSSSSRTSTPFRASSSSRALSTSSSVPLSSSSSVVISSSLSSSFNPKASVSTSSTYLINEEVVNGDDDSDSGSEIDEGRENNRRGSEKSKTDFSRTLTNLSDSLLSHPASQLHENNVDEMAEENKDDNDPSQVFSTMLRHPPPSASALINLNSNSNLSSNSNSRPRRGPGAR